MHRIPEQCPSCGGRLIVTELTCSACGAQVHGQFEPDLFSRLSPTDFDFVVLFVKSKGNVKEMERELGISYWTIRSKLGEIVETLGFGEQAEDDLSLRRRAVLERLRAGEIGVDEAAALLEELKRQR
jgi:hypothetical protein